MGTRATLGLLVVMFLFCSSGAWAADPLTVEGRILDAAGEPAAGVEVATYWIAEEGRWNARQSVRTDAEGAFSFPVRLSSRARSIMALDAAQEMGAVALLDAETAAKPFLLRLQPTTHVTSAYTNQGLGHEIERTFVSFTARPASIAIGSHMGPQALSLRLPPGDYLLRVGGVDCRRISQRLTLTRDMRRVDMGTTDLLPTVIAQHYGKAPPAWHVSEARGVEPTATLADFKGRWVLLEFWGHW